MFGEVGGLINTKVRIQDALRVCHIEIIVFIVLLKGGIKSRREIILLSQFSQ